MKQEPHFNQKDEVFKRARWDKDLIDKLAEISPRDPLREDKPGYRRVDQAFRNASWALEHGYGEGNSRGNHGLYSWEALPEYNGDEDMTPGTPVNLPPEEFSAVVKRAARYYGAALAGITAFDRRYQYSHEYNTATKENPVLKVPEECENVIVMALEMDHESLRGSPDFIAGAATALGYSRMAFVSYMTANFIRRLGYRAIPCGNDTAMSIPLAINAGLGELGRNGLLITEKYGPRVRLCKIITDMPLRHDTFKPFGVEAFCRVCMKCARFCPSGSISRGDKTTEGPSPRSSDSGTLKWYITPESCYTYWKRNGVDCATCIRVCPFTKEQGFLHDMVRFFIRHASFLNRLIVAFDTLLGYHRRKPPADFWNN